MEDIKSFTKKEVTKKKNDWRKYIKEEIKELNKATETETNKENGEIEYIQITQNKRRIKITGRYDENNIIIFIVRLFLF